MASATKLQHGFRLPFGSRFAGAGAGAETAVADWKQSLCIGGAGWFKTPYCPLNTVEPSVTLCAPTTASPSPVRIAAGTTSASAMKSMTVLVDGAKTFCECRDQCDGCLRECGGWNTHSQVLGQNSKGQNFSLARSITVSGRDSSSCANRGIGPVVSICTPLGGSVTGYFDTRGWQFRTGFNPIASTAVYLDGKEVYFQW